MKMYLGVPAIMLLAACATNSPEREAYIAGVKASTPTCAEAKTCEVKWSAARSWLLDNSKMKLQHVTNDYMATFNSTDDMTVVYSVNKSAAADGSYKIVASAGCENPFGCYQDPWRMVKEFNDAVNASVQ